MLRSHRRWCEWDVVGWAEAPASSDPILESQCPAHPRAGGASDWLMHMSISVSLGAGACQGHCSHSQPGQQASSLPWGS